MTALCLDLSRLVSRVGRGAWTGVDRVEAAWLDRLLRGDLPAWGLVRTRLGYILLEAGGLSALADRLRGHVPWGAPDLTARLVHRSDTRAGRVAADLRRHAAGRAARPGLARLLRRLPRGAVYLNTGHANLTARMLGTAAASPGLRVSVLIHDMIPLTHPGFQRPGMPARFEARMRQVARHTDQAIYNSAATRAEAEARFAEWGRVPPGVTAPLGLDPLPTAPPDWPEGLPPAKPYFVCLGTIEPRKNHALLLDVWTALGPAAPALVIVGRRGWANEAVLHRLDTDPAMGRTVFEANGLDDATVTDLLRGASGLLFPSHAEGYGLPALEAARLGTPVVATPLPVFHDLLGDYPVYADADDAYSWKKAVQSLAMTEPSAHVPARPPRPAPSWEAHFNLVLSTF